MSDAPRYARVQATMGTEGWGRHAPHTATVGTLTGRGSSQAAALADLGRLITGACQRDASDAVKFAYDADNGQLWVAVPDVMHDGYRGYAVDVSGDQPAGARLCVNGSGPARDAWSHAVGMAELPGRAPAGQLPQMPDEVRAMLARADDALTALGRYGDNLTEAERDAQSALADLAAHVSAQYAAGELTG